MKRAALLVVLGLGLCGCIPGTSLVQAQASCTAAQPEFVPAWQCIKARIAGGTAGMTNNAQALRYEAVGDALAEQVQSGKLQDQQAKLQLAVELERDESEFKRLAIAARAADPSIVCNRFGATTICN